MGRIVNRKKRQGQARDPEKERIIKELCGKIEAVGFQVRREKLKVGHGWRVISGSCRVDREKYIFVDRRLNQDDQIQFLQSKLMDLSRSARPLQVEVSQQL